MLLEVVLVFACVLAFAFKVEIEANIETANNAKINVTWIFLRIAVSPLRLFVELRSFVKTLTSFHQ